MERGGRRPGGFVLKSWPPWVWTSALAAAVGMDRRWPCFSCSQTRRAPSGGLFWGSPGIAGVTSARPGPLAAPKPPGLPSNPPGIASPSLRAREPFLFCTQGIPRHWGQRTPRVWARAGEGRGQWPVCPPEVGVSFRYFEGPGAAGRVRARLKEPLLPRPQPHPPGPRPLGTFSPGLDRRTNGSPTWTLQKVPEAQKPSLKNSLFEVASFLAHFWC